MASAELQVQLECELPAELAVGLGTAVFVCGWCFHPRVRISSLSLVVGGERQPVIAGRMPRLDPLQALHSQLDVFSSAALAEDPDSADDPLIHSYRSGFWGIARIGSAPAGVGHVEIALEAELEGGGAANTQLGRIPIVTPPRPIRSEWRANERRVAICMATYNPPIDLFEAQLDSIRGQTHENWVCVISDDCSNPEAYAAIARAIGGDPRIHLDRSPGRRGFYHNFERALALTPADAQYVALADQDDVWHPDKLRTLIDAIGRAQLVYSDARVVSRDGKLISDTWWSTRRNNHTDILSLLVANAVTGAASLLRRELLDDALPFPPAQFAHFHDHWIGLVARALGEIAFVDRPLYDYVQHRTASLGHAAANRMTPLGERIRDQAALRERIRMWRLHYFADVCRLLQFATVLQMRCATRMTRPKRRTIERFLRAEGSRVGLAQLAIRGLRELGRPMPETLGAEWMLFLALVWARLVKLTARERPQRRLRLDALPPPSLIQQPRRARMPESARLIEDKIAPLPWRIDDGAPPRINLLIPTFDLGHFFAGYIGKLNLAKRLAERGQRVRIVTVDPGRLPGDWRRRVESYAGLDGFFDAVEVTFGRESSGIELSRADRFIATTWWTAHIAGDALQAVSAERFLYLIQEYEPFTFPMGSYSALAEASYGFPHFALFSTELLRGYFRAHRIGVFAHDPEWGEAHSRSFRNAITDAAPPPAAELIQRRPRRLLLYARPEPHASRNMFELALLGLGRALDEGAFSGWELRGVGSVGRGRQEIALGDGATMVVSPRSDQASYARLLREHDVGLALMYTPHPSLVPIEMAAAGMLAVTSTFENKTPQALAEISANLIAAAPTIEGVAAALHEAQAGVSDVARRLRGSDVRWSRTWNEAFGDELLDTLFGAFDAVDVAVA